MAVSYRNVTAFPGCEGTDLFLISLIERYNFKHILEIGSGANPTLKVGDVRSRGISYVTSDWMPRRWKRPTRRSSGWWLTWRQWA
jgi:hypothetical protein